MLLRFFLPARASKAFSPRRASPSVWDIANSGESTAPSIRVSRESKSGKGKGPRRNGDLFFTVTPPPRLRRRRIRAFAGFSRADSAAGIVQIGTTRIRSEWVRIMIVVFVLFSFFRPTGRRIRIATTVWTIHRHRRIHGPTGHRRESLTRRRLDRQEVEFKTTSRRNERHCFIFSLDFALLWYFPSGATRRSF